MTKGGGKLGRKGPLTRDALCERALSDASWLENVIKADTVMNLIKKNAIEHILYRSKAQVPYTAHTMRNVTQAFPDLRVNRAPYGLAWQSCA